MKFFHFVLDTMDYLAHLDLSTHFQINAKLNNVVVEVYFRYYLCLFLFLSVVSKRLVDTETSLVAIAINI